jgi:hypothetical protein
MTNATITSTLRMPIKAGLALPGVRRWTFATARFVLCVTLVVAAGGKVANPYSFLTALYDLRLIGPEAARVVAVVLPFCELGLAACLLSGFALRGAMLCTAALFALFVFVLSSVVIRGIVASCGCFGTAGADPIGWATVLRTSSLFAVAVIGVWSCGRDRDGTSDITDSR